MADSESDGGSDAGNTTGEDGLDTTNLEGLSEKDRKKWEKSLEKWRIFMDFIVRHIAVATFRYNCFEQEDLHQFMLALERGEVIRSKTKLKKGEDARISSFKVMRDTTDLMVQHRYVNEANQIRKFLDIAGRMRGICTIAGGFYKALKKGNVSGQEKIKYYLDYWKGFTVRTYDYRELQFKGVDPDSFNELERKYLVWPTVVRTGIHLSQRFLKKISESTGLELVSPDPKVIQKHMQAAEFVIATKIEDMLFQKIVRESQSLLLLGGSPSSAAPQDTTRKETSVITVADINPDWLKPVADDEMLLGLPPDPPKEKKGGKKKKGSGGKAKGRSTSASSHKGGKKKKKK